jgi:hypothetical protein
MPFESEYKLEDVAATRVPADKIDATFRSSTIGQFHLLLLSSLRQCGTLKHLYLCFLWKATAETLCFTVLPVPDRVRNHSNPHPSPKHPT